MLLSGLVVVQFHEMRFDGSALFSLNFCLFAMIFGTITAVAYVLKMAQNGWCKFA